MITGRLTTGDWSDDGHGKTDTIDISIPEGLTGKSKPKQEHKEKTWGCGSTPDLWFYFKLAVDSGIPDITTCCEDYEDSTVDEETAKALMAAFGDDIFEDGFEEGEDTYIGSDSFANIWVATVNKGIALNGETGEVKIIPGSPLNYNIGGYGLFS